MFVPPSSQNASCSWNEKKNALPVQYGRLGANWMVPPRSYNTPDRETSKTTSKHGSALTMCLFWRPVMFILVSMFRVVPGGIETVAHAAFWAAARKAGASSLPLARSVQVVLAAVACVAKSAIGRSCGIVRPMERIFRRSGVHSYSYKL